MNRNIQKQRDLGEKVLKDNARFRLSSGEMMQIYEKYKESATGSDSFSAFWETVLDVYKMGVATGSRIEKAKSAS